MPGKRIFLEEVLDAYAKTGMQPSVFNCDFEKADGLEVLWHARHKIPTTRRNKDGKEVKLGKYELICIVDCMIYDWSKERYGDEIICNGVKVLVIPYVSGFINGWDNIIARNRKNHLCCPENQLERFEQGIFDGASISSHIFGYRL